MTKKGTEDADGGWDAIQLPLLSEALCINHKTTALPLAS